MNNKFYNVRDKMGRFTFLPGKKSINFRPNIVSGRLYRWHNVIVRAKCRTNNNL